MEKLNFKENKVQVLSLEELERTYHENHVDGTPVGGVYHFVLLQEILDILSKAGLKADVQEIFAANNRDAQRPGVTLLPQLEEKFGEGALEAHVLRRVYANVALLDGETDDFVTNLAVAYHQRGIQVAIGPMVKVCHNQCIMGRADVAANYSMFGGRANNEKLALQGIYGKVAEWACLHSLDGGSRRTEKIEKLQGVPFGKFDAYEFVGRLVEERVICDSHIPEVRRATREAERIVDYPLNSAQINSVAETMFSRGYATGLPEPPSTIWDAYNLCTEVLKPNQMDIPAVIPQHVALWEILSTMSCVLQFSKSLSNEG